MTYIESSGSFQMNSDSVFKILFTKASATHSKMSSSRTLSTSETTRTTFVVGKQINRFPNEAPIDRRKASQVVREELFIKIRPPWQDPLNLRGLKQVLVEVREQLTFLVSIVEIWRSFLRAPKRSNSMLGHNSSSRHSRVVEYMFSLCSFDQRSHNGPCISPLFC